MSSYGDSGEVALDAEPAEMAGVLAPFLLHRRRESGPGLSEEIVMRIHRVVLGLLAAIVVAAPASAQTVHSLSFGAGLFAPRGVEGRVEGDVLTRNYLGRRLPGYPSLTDALAFEIQDFRSGSVFGEWNVAFGRRVEFGIGVGAYGRSVNTVYLDVVDDFNRDIDQTLRLRVVPMTAIVRLLPFGRAGDVQPYVGGGVALLNYRYSEVGRFVDADTLDIFEDRFTATGTTPGGVLLGGLKLPFGGDIYGMSLEGRYIMGAGDTGGLDAGFLDDKIDLSGFHFNVGFHVRF